MKDRALSTITLWGAVGAIIWIGSLFSASEIFAFCILAALTAIAQWEFYKLTESCNEQPNKTQGIIIGLIYLFFVFFFSPENYRHSIFPIALATAFGIHLLSLLRNPSERPVLLRKLPTFYGFLYIPLMLSFLVFIAKLNVGSGLSQKSIGLACVIWLVVAAKFTDVGGLVIGTLFGKHKIAPSISPAKSWEGCLGGLVFSAAAAALFAWAVNAFWFPFMTPLRSAILALPIAIVSIPSDLVESVFKRQSTSKDSGHTIPGIGGALDLIDSLILTAPLGFVVLSYAYSWACG
ncbi:MAG: phosphatidate cytidylyltransferase [Opitutales bacterium]|nr:phosphatidate cytidylyltransferase [Opitutales bacterium]